MYSYNKLFTLLSLFAILYLSGQRGFQVEGGKSKHAPKKLFVFGDSYCDTGNIKKAIANSWKDPYGVTFPGKPVGRFSDGRVFTDYLDLKNSVALVSVAGNDYSYYLTTNGSLAGIPSFIASLVNQTTIDLIRLKKLGVKKVVVDGLQPLGCLPFATALSSFKQCNSTANALTNLHNSLLIQSVAKLNQENKDHPSFIILDFYDAFLSVLQNPSKHNIENPLKPCCTGAIGGYKCGSVDNNNVKKYTVCDNPKKAFFWDDVHPTQAGWNAVFHELKSTKALHQILHN
ncbi:unnamed protein product [Lupinus luteus]|uniref:GDSL esterase/lipase n=1 Tax=Lupinus luteus TaxID=3873 RepID=A0AAV1XYG7_LUPLU